jgi:hypothetical protein
MADITMIAPWCGGLVVWRCFSLSTEIPASSSALLLIKVLRDSGVGALIV